MNNKESLPLILPKKKRSTDDQKKANPYPKPPALTRKRPEISRRHRNVVTSDPETPSRTVILTKKNSQRILPSDDHRLARIASLKNFVTRVKAKYSIDTDRDIPHRIGVSEPAEKKAKKEHRHHHHHHHKNTIVEESKDAKPQLVTKATDMSSLDKFFFTYEKKKVVDPKTWLKKGNAKTLDKHMGIPDLCMKLDKMCALLRRNSEARRRQAMVREKDPNRQLLKFHFKPPPYSPYQEPRTFDYNRFSTNYPAIPEPIKPKDNQQVFLKTNTKKPVDDKFQTKNPSDEAKKKKDFHYTQLVGPMPANFRKSRRRRRPRRRFFNFNQPSPITGSYFSTKSGTYDSRPWLYRGNHKKRLFNYMMVPSKYSEQTRLKFLRKYLMQIEREQNEPPRRRRRLPIRANNNAQPMRKHWPSFPFIKNFELEKGKLDKLLSLKPVKLSEICSDPSDIRQIFAALKIRSGLHAMSLCNPTSKMVYEWCLRKELEDPTWTKSSNGEREISSYSFSSQQNSAVIDPIEQARFPIRFEKFSKELAAKGLSSPPMKNPENFMTRGEKECIICGLWKIMTLYDNMYARSRLPFWNKRIPKRKVSLRTQCYLLNCKGCPPQRPNTPTTPSSEKMKLQRKPYMESSFLEPPKTKKLDLVLKKNNPTYPIGIRSKKPQQINPKMQNMFAGCCCGCLTVPQVRQIPDKAKKCEELLRALKFKMKLDELKEGTTHHLSSYQKWGNIIKTKRCSNKMDNTLTETQLRDGR